MGPGQTRSFSACPLGIRLGVHAKLDAADLDRVAVVERALRHLLAVHERPVRASQIFELQLIGVAEGKPAMDPRYQRDIDDEIGARRPAHGLQRARQQTKGQIAVRRVDGLKGPHTSIMVQAGHGHEGLARRRVHQVR